MVNPASSWAQKPTHCRIPHRIEQPCPGGRMADIQIRQIDGQIVKSGWPPMWRHCYKNNMRLLRNGRRDNRGILMRERSAAIGRAQRRRCWRWAGCLSDSIICVLRNARLYGTFPSPGGIISGSCGTSCLIHGKSLWLETTPAAGSISDGWHSPDCPKGRRPGQPSLGGADAKVCLARGGRLFGSPVVYPSAIRAALEWEKNWRDTGHWANQDE